MVIHHLNFLKQLEHNDPEYIGPNSLDWANLVLGANANIDASLNSKFDRYELLKHCNNNANCDLDCSVAILSWGGMRRNHGRILFNEINHFMVIIEKLRNETFESRENAFRAFHEMRQNDFLPRLGVSYFTKLICFLHHTLKGYILDQ